MARSTTVCATLQLSTGPMDKVNRYRTELKRVLQAYADIVRLQPTPGVETLLAFDEVRDQYLWLQVGWIERRRNYGVTVHARIVDGKIRIEQDWTEGGIVGDLLRAGVPRDDLVLAFHEPVADQAPDILEAHDLSGATLA